MSETQPQPGQSIRVLYDGKPERGGRRIEYDPEWSPTLPYCTFKAGKAGRQFGCLEHAKQFLAPKHAKWSEWT